MPSCYLKQIKMYNTKYVDVNQIIDRIKRGNLYKEMSYETAIDYAVDAYRLLNNEKAEITKPYIRQVINHRALLPEDFERVMATAKTDAGLTCLFPMGYATSHVNTVRHCLGSPDLNCSSPYTYDLNNSYINTSFEEGWILMIYKGLKMNKDGVIMIPDEVNTIKAVGSYIKSNYLRDLASDDPVVNKHMDLEEQDYCWYIGKAQAAMSDLSYDQYRALANSLSKFFINDDSFNSFLGDMGIKEHLVNQRNG